MDPGSVLDFEYVIEQVRSLIHLSQLKYIVLSHQDPDLCSSTPLFEKAGFSGQIATHWRASVLSKYYGIRSPFYLVNENGYQLTLGSGRKIDFIPTPYLHFPGSVATYDARTKVLFSQDLFGAFCQEWTFYAQKETYLQAMAAFHEHYMPSNDNLRPVMELLLQMDIASIAPQHGSVIDRDIRDYIITLRDLECGTYLRPIRKELSESGGYTGVCQEVLRRLAAVFRPAEVAGVFAGSDIKVAEPSMEITDFASSGFELWNELFDRIAAQQGQRWLTVSEPFVEKLASEYDIPMPNVFASARVEAERHAAEMTRQNQELRELNERLGQTLARTEDLLTRCPVTKLRNEQFLTSYLTTLVPDFDDTPADLALLCVSVDNFEEIIARHGKDVADEALRAAAYVVNQQRNDNQLVARLDGPTLGLVVPQAGDSTAARADLLRAAVADSTLFLEPITVSIGLADLGELDAGWHEPADAIAGLMTLARRRMQIARHRGGNTVCAASSRDEASAAAGHILVVDPDPIAVDVLRVAMAALHYRVTSCPDGDAALDLMAADVPDLVITETMLPKIDGFAVRERMLAATALKDVPVIMVSHVKDFAAVERAHGMNVQHLLRKPFLLSELVGIVHMTMQGAPR